MAKINKQSFGYSEKIPEDIRSTFVLLCDELQFLQSKWDFYKELYGTKQNTDLLSELAFWSFKIVERSLLYDITIAISRLNDPSEDGTDKNLSLEYLAKKCPEISNINELLATFQDTCRPIKKFRNKLVSHNDLKTILAPKSYLSHITKERIDLVLELAADILNTVYGCYKNGELYFHTSAPGGAKSLIYWLNEGKKFHARKFPKTS